MGALQTFSAFGVKMAPAEFPEKRIRRNMFLLKKLVCRESGEGFAEIPDTEKINCAISSLFSLSSLIFHLMKMLLGSRGIVLQHLGTLVFSSTKMKFISWLLTLMFI